MVESDRHKQMKRAAAAVLESEGYDVQFEKPLSHVRPDVFAESIDETVAVEIGNLGNQRADELRDVCDRLVHIPYGEYEDSNPSSDTETARRNLVVNEAEWEKFGNNVGSRQRSKTVRDMITVYNRMFGGEDL